MAKEYDPILCMMVDKASKAQDANKYVEQAIKWMKEGKGRLYILSGLQQMGLTSGDAVKYYAEAMTETGYKYRPKDAKAIDRLVKVPDNKLKEFEGILRSAGFKIVSKSDRGMTTHYQVEVDSPKKFSTEAELREWAKKIDDACDKMDATAPTTWNIGLTTNGKITAGLDVREMYVKDSASVLDSAISTCDAASGDIMKQIASTAKSWAKQYNQLFEKATTAEEVKKLRSNAENDLDRAINNLDKIYNEVSQDYGKSRNEIRHLFDEVLSNGFKAYQRVTGGKK